MRAEHFWPTIAVRVMTCSRAICDANSVLDSTRAVGAVIRMLQQVGSLPA